MAMTEVNKSAVSFVVALIFGLGGGYILGAGYNPPPKIIRNVVESGITAKQINLAKEMRELWADNVIWTRQYITAYFSGNGNVRDISNRLMQNQIDIGNAIAAYYGGNAGTEVTSLLKQHVLIAIDLIDAAKNNDIEEMDSAEERWNDSALRIAVFLSSTNQNWPKKDILSKLHRNLALAKKDIEAYQTGKWSDNIALFDQIFDENMAMADILSNGIIKQFPNKF